MIGEAANSVGGYLANCIPGVRGLNAKAMLEQPRKAYVLLNIEPELDCQDPRAAIRALNAAELVVALSAYKGFVPDYAHVLLPIAPFSETAGTFVNCEGRMQSFNPAVKPLGDARPAWKVLRVLANLLGLQGFGHDTSEAVRDEACPQDAITAKLDNRLEGLPIALKAAPGAQRRRAICKESPTFPSISPIRSCAAPRPCRKPGMRGCPRPGCTRRSRGSSVSRKAKR